MNWDMHHCHIPLYKISTAKTPIAFIFTAGKQIKIVKVNEKHNYFVHKDYGLFELKQEFVFFINKTPVYFFDTRNQNPLNMPLMDELYKWAEKNKLSVITRENIKDGIRLRRSNKEDITKKKKEKIKIVEKKIDTLKKQALEKNEKVKKLDDESITGLDSQDVKVTENDITFSIIKILLSEKIIDTEKALLLEEKLSNGNLNIDDFMEDLKEFEKITVNEPLQHKLDMVLEEFHTFNPKDVMGVISYATKIDKALKSLRANGIGGVIPTKYLFFGLLAIIMVIVLFGGGEAGSMFGF